jgi:hypothetical protein
MSTCILLSISCISSLLLLFFWRLCLAECYFCHGSPGFPLLTTDNQDYVRHTQNPHVHIYWRLLCWNDWANGYLCRSHWPRVLRRRSAAARLPRLWVRIPPCSWMSVCCECCVLSGRGLCDEQVTRPDESYRLWCVFVCDLETSWMRGSCPTGGGGCRAQKKWLLYWDRLESSGQVATPIKCCMQLLVTNEERASLMISAGW